MVQPHLEQIPEALEVVEAVILVVVEELVPIIYQIPEGTKSSAELEVVARTLFPHKFLDCRTASLRPWREALLSHFSEEVNCFSPIYVILASYRKAKCRPKL